jgi:hypothetical protein
MNYDIANSEADRIALMDAVGDPQRVHALFADPGLSDAALFYIANQADRVAVLALVLVAEHQKAEEPTQRLAWESAVRLRRNQALIPLGLSARAHPVVLDETVNRELSQYASGRAPSELGQQFLVFAASNPNTPPPTLARLGTAPDLRVRAGVGANPHTPMGTLGLLANDMAMEVRRAVALNPAIGIAVIRRLSGDILDVRMRLVENAAALLRQPESSTLVLRALAKDENRYVAGMAQRQLGTIGLLRNQATAANADVEDVEIIDAELSADVRSGPPPLPGEGPLIDLKSNVEMTQTPKAPGEYVRDVVEKIESEQRPDRLFELLTAGVIQFEERVLGNVGVESKTTTVLSPFPKPTMMERQAEAVAKAVRVDPPSAGVPDMPPLPALPQGSSPAHSDDLPALAAPRDGRAPTA